MSSVLALLLGIGGMYVAWLMYAARRVRRAALPFAQRVLEHKFYFDELYDAIFYDRPSGLRRAAQDGVEDPLIDGGVATSAAGHA